LKAIQGTTVRAANVEKVMVKGTLAAMGAMYGPIMPVMKNMGRKETMMASVDMRTGGNTSRTAASVAHRGWAGLDRMWRWMLSMLVMGSSTTMPRERISANRVTRLMVYPDR